ncbi:MAG: winged helix-turn-helix transcriptional regulator [Clostridia bacterium]|nr:winged helix-turn-helix transcriptional regulator [Clostridia bacterium]
MNNSHAARIFKAFCDENRIAILRLLQGGEMCACKLLDALSISQPTLSHHMRILCDAGVVNPRREGKWTHYSLNSEGCAEAIALLKEVLNQD